MTAEDQARALLAERPFPPNPWVRVGEDDIVIRAGYNEAMQRMLRWVPKAQWRADTRCWHIPLAGAELVRAILPELSRLAEAMQEEAMPTALATSGASGPLDEAQARAAFRDAARLLYGSDWQRETARALSRDEAALACWLVGEGVAEAPPAQLLHEILALMRSRAKRIQEAADALAERISPAGSPTAH